MLTGKIDTMSATDLLEWCDYDVKNMTPLARRLAAMRLRNKYGLTAIQGPKRGLRYSRAEVHRKIQFIRIQNTQ